MSEEKANSYVVQVTRSMYNTQYLWCSNYGDEWEVSDDHLATRFSLREAQKTAEKHNIEARKKHWSVVYSVLPCTQ